MNWFWFVIGVLATYRIAELFALDDGPFDLFKSIREGFGKRAYRNKLMKNFADLFSCPFCIGVWISIIIGIVILYWLNPVTKTILIILALAGGQSFLENRRNNA